MISATLNTLPIWLPLLIRDISSPFRRISQARTSARPESGPDPLRPGSLQHLPGCFLVGSYPWWRCIWNALFLAVSSFCNAGLTPFPGSLIHQHWLTRIGCGGMIVLGGLGVYVIYDLLQVCRKRQRALRVHSKLALVTTAVLLAGGTVLLKFFSFLADTPIGWGESLFMSATCRTAGFACVDIAELPAVSLALCIMLMMIGGCSGSTAGGVKVYRIVLLMKQFAKELSVLRHPREVKLLRMDGNTVKESVIRSTNVFISIYFVIFFISLLFISIENYDFTTGFTAVAATINNIGPGLSLVGPTCNYGFFSAYSKIILIFDMLAGRLELFPMLLFFSMLKPRRK